MSTFSTISSKISEYSALLIWVNQNLKLQTKCLEELSSGAVFCQILDLIYDGMVPMQKVNWQSEKTSDWVLNFEVLTSCLKKFQVGKEIYVERLIAGEKMEIGLLLDWLVQFSGSNRNLGDNYDAVERRGTKHPNFAFADKIRLRHQESDAIQEKTNKENIGAPAIGKSYDPKTIQKLAQFDSMKSERDFYYSKLRDIDQVLDTYKESNVQTLIQTIRDIIYVTPEMVSIVTEDGHVVIKGDNENKYDDTFNQNMNFANANNSELSEFNFDSNINLLNENMDLESFK